MLTGVAAGMAGYFDVGPMLMRVGWVIFGLASAGTALIAYIALAIVLPKDDSAGVEMSGAGDKGSDNEAVRPWRQRRRSLLAFVFIAVGSIVLAANFGLFGWWRWDVVWPLALIAAGGWILLARYRGRA